MIAKTVTIRGQKTRIKARMGLSCRQIGEQIIFPPRMCMSIHKYTRSERCGGTGYVQGCCFLNNEYHTWLFKKLAIYYTKVSYYILIGQDVKSIIISKKKEIK